MVDDVASLSVSGVASEGSSELLKTAKQGVAPSSNLSISYLMAKQREFHVIGKAGLDPKQVASNYKVLKGCIKDVRDFVVEAEMRLHRQPTVGLFFYDALESFMRRSLGIFNLSSPLHTLPHDPHRNYASQKR